MEKRIEDVLERIRKNSNAFLGYPVAKDFDYSEFAPFLKLCINNVGDPESISTFSIDTKDIEKEVIAFFTELLSASTDKVWGYVTNGGTEGNLYGLYLARERYKNAIVYHSESTHYSVKKNLHLLNLENITVRCQENGEIDYDDLDHLLTLNRQKPAIFFLNIGTTMTEAIDKIDEIKRLIRKYAIKDYYIHCDAAFLGCMAPFMSSKPKFDFSEGIDSISISGHKFIGGPISCGVVLTKREHRNLVLNSISYVDTLDTTITGSRNGLTPLFLWSFIQKHGKEGLRKRLEKSQQLASYTQNQLKLLNINVSRNEEAITIGFDKPSKELCTKYQLASQGNLAHIICVPGIEQHQIDDFINEYKLELEEINLSKMKQETLESVPTR